MALGYGVGRALTSERRRRESVKRRFIPRLKRSPRIAARSERRRRSLSFLFFFQGYTLITASATGICDCAAAVGRQLSRRCEPE